ncbi:PorT family protein [Hymenobacter lutimineralis]|uniref:PorT family protein n=1 Tax=Hymenobacter lutimineralis TaxID=2606448 RepID=A0A5D6VFU4_9BACT|nr:outer membrane beta-barrel protein [Hymenobacter lutimineralis]TYZ13394.1 PorT family protein [Hymenobacter lutimineralis]
MRFFTPALCSILITFSTAVYAQRVAIGPRAGMSFSRLNGLEGNRYRSVSHQYAGVNLIFRAQQQLTLQSGLEWVRKGYKSKSGALINAGSSSYLEQDNAQLDYLDIPLLAHYQGKNWSLGLGPRYSILLQTQRNVQRTLLPSGEVEYFRQTDNSNRVYSNSTLGFITQAAYQLPGGFGVDVRFNQDFSQIINRQPFTKMMNVQAGLTYYFALDKRKIPGGTKRDSLAVALNSFKITEQQNVTRANIQRVGEGQTIRLVRSQNATGANITNLQLLGSSGNVEQSGIQNSGFVGFRNVVFPFQGTISYLVNSVPIRLQFTIYEPGDWSVFMSN